MTSLINPDLFHKPQEGLLVFQKQVTAQRWRIDILARHPNRLMTLHLTSYRHKPITDWPAWVEYQKIRKTNLVKAQNYLALETTKAWADQLVKKDLITQEEKRQAYKAMASVYHADRSFQRDWRKSRYLIDILKHKLAEGSFPLGV